MMISARPDATASSTTYWIVGLSTSGSISLGWAFVAGRNRVPNPAAGKTAFVMRIVLISSHSLTGCALSGLHSLRSLNHRAHAEPTRPVEEVERDEQIIVQPFPQR